MIKPDQIPPEVVEAAARAAHNEWRHECAAKDQEDVSYWLTWEALEEEADREDWRNQARAAIAAALNAWPGAEQDRLFHGFDGGSYYFHPRLSLPLPMEMHDE